MPRTSSLRLSDDEALPERSERGRFDGGGGGGGLSVSSMTTGSSEEEEAIGERAGAAGAFQNIYDLAVRLPNHTWEPGGEPRRR